MASLSIITLKKELIYKLKIEILKKIWVVLLPNIVEIILTMNRPLKVNV